MADIRLKSERLELTDGNVFDISCPMMALAKIEDTFGSVEAALSGQQPWNTALTLLMIFVNCAAEIAGSDTRYTKLELAKVLPNYNSKHYIDLVMNLTLDALGTEPLVAEETDSKN